MEIPYADMNIVPTHSKARNNFRRPGLVVNVSLWTLDLSDDSIKGVHFCALTMSARISDVACLQQITFDEHQMCGCSV